MKPYTHLWYFFHFLLEWEIFQAKVVQKIKIHILCSICFFFENRAVYEIMLQNRVEPDATDNILRPMRIAYCITEGYRYTIRICNAYCFSTAIIITWTRLIITFTVPYVHCLACYIYFAVWRIKSSRMWRHVGLLTPLNLEAHRNSVTRSEQFPQQYAIYNWIKNRFPEIITHNFTKYS